MSEFLPQELIRLPCAGLDRERPLGKRNQILTQSAAKFKVDQKKSFTYLDNPRSDDYLILLTLQG